jgi:hypothetical protein
MAQKSLAAPLLLVALFFAPLPAPAQLYTGSVTGVVKDSSGATIPAVKITLVDQGKGYSFTATTDNTGRYLLRSIPPGTYTITAEAANFERKPRRTSRLMSAKTSLSIYFEGRLHQRHRRSKSQQRSTTNRGCRHWPSRQSKVCE